jgi:hypothetical protein
MRILAVTHPDSAARSPRSLSDGGRLQALSAARRLRELAGKKTVLKAILSSPKARCLETAILVAREFGETTKEEECFDRVEVRAELEEGQSPIQPDALKGLFGEIRNGLLAQSRQGAQWSPDWAILVSMHGDLVGVIGSSATLATEIAPGSSIASGGWFDVRPVIAVCDYDDQFSVKNCEALFAGSWASCL